MSEARLWNYLRWRLDPDRIDAVRVENLVGPGTPDVNFCAAPLEGWIELKYRRREPARPTSRLWPREKGLSPEQVRWIVRRVGVGGVVWIVAGVGQRVYFVPGRYAPGFNDWTLSQLARRSALVVARRDPGAAQAINTMLSTPPPAIAPLRPSPARVAPRTKPARARSRAALPIIRRRS